MRWTPGHNAGFTEPESEPWIPLGGDHERFNVESELEDPGSMLNLYRRLLELRRGSTALKLGSFLSHPASTDEVYAYQRISDDEKPGRWCSISVSDPKCCRWEWERSSSQRRTRRGPIRFQAKLTWPGKGVIIGKHLRLRHPEQFTIFRMAPLVGE